MYLKLGTNLDTSFHSGPKNGVLDRLDGDISTFLACREGLIQKYCTVRYLILRQYLLVTWITDDSAMTRECDPDLATWIIKTLYMYN